MAASNPSSGQNPDYYAETASIAPAPAPHNAEQAHVPQQPPQQPQQFYHPPPGPPPGPPPTQNPSYPPPPGPPPALAPGFAPAPAFGSAGPAPASDHEVPPPYPPRPTFEAPPNQQQPQQQQGQDQKKKTTFGERFYQWSSKAGVPINKLTNKLGSEAFWPTALDQECAKAARILSSFSKDGFYAAAKPDGTPDATAKPPSPGPGSGPKSKPKVLVKIPPKAIASAAGLAIFTTFRTGLHISGAGGSGVVLSRLPDGSWSPPSGFLVHTLGAGFMIGLDIYDCVCVLRTPEAVKAFTNPRVSLGGEIGLVAGPIGAGTSVEAAIAKSTKPVWSYMKSRGLYAGVQADGTIIVARPDANAAFYGQKGITVQQILAGQVPPQGPSGMWPAGAAPLYEVLGVAEGRKGDINNAAVRDIIDGPTPGDLAVDGGEVAAEKEMLDKKK